MERRITEWVLLMIFLAIFSVGVYAEVFPSEVRSVNTAANQITVVKKDPVTGKASAEEFLVETSGKTKLKNFASLEDLRPGDEVNVNAKWREKQNAWQAKSLSVAKVKIKQ